MDDELSTGATIINTIRELHRTSPHHHYVVASLVDLRSQGDRDRLDDLAHELGTRISAVALAHGSIRLPETLATDAADLISSLPLTRALPRPAGITLLDLNGVVPPIRSARFGVASLQGRKLYCAPAPITKEAAVADVRRRSEAGCR